MRPDESAGKTSTGAAAGGRQCRVCGVFAAAEPTGGSSNGYELCSCSNCRTVMVEDGAATQQVERLYDELFESGEYSEHRREFAAMKQGRRVVSFSRLGFLKSMERLTAGRHLAEIGGGTGAFGVLAKARGWTYTNWDISGVAVQCARELSLDARHFDPAGAPPLPPRSLDAIVMWEVIEHVWNLHEYARVIRRALRPGGIVVVSTPNYGRARYRQAVASGRGLSVAPIHVNYFTAASLTNAFQRWGFADVSISTRRLNRPSPSLASVLQNLQIALYLDQPKTLYAVTRAD